MLLQRFRQIQSAPDPMTEWIREREAEASKKVLARAALLFVLLVPMMFMARNGTAPASDPLWLIAFTALLLPILAAAILLALANGRTWLVRLPLIEASFWLVFLLLIPIAGYLQALLDLSIPLNVAERKVTFPNEASRSILAWTLIAYSSVGLMLSTWGLIGRPKWYAALIILNLFNSFWNEPAFKGNGEAAICLIAMNILAVSIHWSRFSFGRRTYRENQTLEQTTNRDNQWLSSLLPPDVFAKVARNERVADAFSNLTIVFADMVGFTDLSRRTSPGHLVEILNEMFGAADVCCEANGLERVKTIGDCYMAVAGGIRSKEVGAADAVRFAKQYIDQLAEMADKHDIAIAVRAGVHTGPAIGGVIGSTRPAYDYWGDAVNRASRLESNSRPGGVLLSESTWLQVRKVIACDAPIELEMKGLGLVKAYFISNEDSPSAEVISLKGR